MRSPAGLTLLICLTIAVQPAFAQAPASGFRSLVFPIQDLSPTDASQGYQSTITEAVRAAFEGGGLHGARGHRVDLPRRQPGTST